LFKTFLYVSKESKVVLQKEVEVLGLVPVDELDDGFKIQEVNNLFWVWKIREQQGMVAYQLRMEDVGYQRWRSWNFIEIFYFDL